MAIKSNTAIKISQKHLLGIQDLSINDVNLILEEAHTFIKVNQSKNKKINALNGKTQINLFFEPSTRTQSSFELAGKSLLCRFITLRRRDQQMRWFCPSE